jgi:hypothetical protein
MDRASIEKSLNALLELHELSGQDDPDEVREIVGWLRDQFNEIVDLLCAEGRGRD